MADKPSEKPEDVSAKLEQELRRGVIVLATLSQLRESDEAQTEG